MSYDTEEDLRNTATELANYAVGGDDGRVRGDEVFEEVTEGRTKWPGYFSCGDLPHWMLGKLGVTDERLVNRSDDGGKVPWRMGVNINRLVFQAGKAFVWARGNLRPKPGDVLYVAYPEHVCVLESLDEAAGEVTVLEYGQFDKKRGLPSAHRKTYAFRKAGVQLLVGKRVLRGWLDIVKAPGLLTGKAGRGEPDRPPFQL